MSTTMIDNTNHPALVSAQDGWSNAWGAKLYPGRILTAIVREDNIIAPSVREEVIRRATITGHADSMFSVPARANVGGRKRRGYITVSTLAGMDTETDDDPRVYVFIPYKQEA